MGLSVSYDCFDGPYSRFFRLRCLIAAAIGIPEYDFSAEPKVPRAYKICEEKLEKIKDTDPLYILLCHSDCDGIIEHEHLGPIFSRLYEISPILYVQSPELLTQQSLYDYFRFLFGLERALKTKDSYLEFA